MVRRVRTLFRWCRIFVLLVVLAAVAFVAYLHTVGLPDFLKRPLLQRLLASDVVAEFSNMQLSWRRGPSVIIENASFTRARQPLSPRLTASRAELTLDWNALRRGRLHARTLEVANAEWRLPVSAASGDALVLHHLVLDMRFDPDDTMRVDNCRGVFRGVQIDLIGRVKHIKDLRRWIYPATGGRNSSLQARIEQFARVVEQIHMSGTPLVQIEAGGDGQDLNSFHAELTFAANDAQTPWGNATNATLTVAATRLINPGRDAFCQISATASDLHTPWAQGHNVSFSTILSRAANSNLEAGIHLKAAGVSAPLKFAGDTLVAAGRLSWDGRVTLAPTNLVLWQAAGKLHVTEAVTPWGSAGEVSLDSTLARGPARRPPMPCGGPGPALPHGSSIPSWTWATFPVPNCAAIMSPSPAAGQLPTSWWMT